MVSNSTMLSNLQSLRKDCPASALHAGFLRSCVWRLCHQEEKGKSQARQLWTFSQCGRGVSMLLGLWPPDLREQQRFHWSQLSHESSQPFFANRHKRPHHAHSWSLWRGGCQTCFVCFGGKCPPFHGFSYVGWHIWASSRSRPR